MAKYSLSTLPKNLDELKSLPMSDLKDPEATALLTVAAFARYPESPEDCLAMIDYLKGPAEVSTYEKSFIKDRFATQSFIPMSYLQGATPENGYVPNVPYEITVVENPHADDLLAEGYKKVYLKSSGADAPRYLNLRTKPSTGQWFLHEQFILVSVRDKVDAAWV